MRKALIGFLLIPLGLASSQGLGPILKKHSQIDWKASGSLPPGAEYHLIYEDKNTHAIETLARFPSGYALPPHSHTSDETLLIITGKLLVEINGQTTALEAGSYAVIPSGTVHALKASGWKGCEMLVSMSGPFDIKGLPTLKR